VPSNGTVVKIFIHPENDLDGELDRTKPLDIYDDFELIDKYRFDRQSIMMICDMLQDDLERSTFRNRAYFYLCFIYMIFIMSRFRVS
jgi:hypothetical protein